MHYRSSKNAWQTRDLFKEWFFEVFVPLVKKNLNEKNLQPKAILLLDNATCHWNEEVLKTNDGNIFTVFLPPNTTSLIQPLDQGIIKALKQIYRKNLLNELLMIDGTNLSEKLKNISLKNVVFLITESWNNVKDSVIVSGFHAVLDSKHKNCGTVEFNDIACNDNTNLVKLYHRVTSCTDVSDLDIINWSTGTNESSRIITDDEIIDSALGYIEKDDDENIEISQDIDNVIKGINAVIQWAETSLTIDEILFLRRIREIAHSQKDYED